MMLRESISEIKLMIQGYHQGKHLSSQQLLDLPIPNVGCLFLV